MNKRLVKKSVKAGLCYNPAKGVRYAMIANPDTRVLQSCSTGELWRAIHGCTHGGRRAVIVKYNDGSMAMWYGRKAGHIRYDVDDQHFVLVFDAKRPGPYYAVAVNDAENTCFAQVISDVEWATLDKLSEELDEWAHSKNALVG